MCMSIPYIHYTLLDILTPKYASMFIPEASAGLYKVYM